MAVFIQPGIQSAKCFVVSFLLSLSSSAIRSSKMRATVYSLLKNALKLLRDVRLQTNSTNSYPSPSPPSSDGKQKLSSQCKDLETCIYFLLVQLYVPSGKWQDWACGKKKRTISHGGSDYEEMGSESGESLTNETEGTDGDDNESFLTGVSIDTQSLFKSEKCLLQEHKKAHEISRLDLTIEERCRAALDYTLQCFQFLQQFGSTSMMKEHRYLLQLVLAC